MIFYHILFFLSILYKKNYDYFSKNLRLIFQGAQNAPRTVKIRASLKIRVTEPHRSGLKTPPAGP